MRLRKLELRDAYLMLEWMHDEDVIEKLQGRFMEKTLDDCEAFIIASQSSSDDVHFAVVNDDDEYMGTVSLKNVDKENNCAEFAIAMRKSAMGKGFAGFGIHEIIRYGFNELGLSEIYWCVDPLNARAVKFYDKHGFSRLAIVNDVYGKNYDYHQKKQYIWYIVNK